MGQVVKGMSGIKKVDKSRQSKNQVPTHLCGFMSLDPH